MSSEPHQIEPITTRRQIEWIEGLRSLAAHRESEAIAIEQRHRQREAGQVAQHEADREAATGRFRTEHSQQIAEFKAERERVFAECEREGAALAQDQDRDQESAEEEHAQNREALRSLRQQRTEKILQKFKEDDVQPRTDFARFKEQCDYSAGELGALVIRAQSLVRGLVPWPEETSPPPLPPAGQSREQYLGRFQAAMSEGVALVGKLHRQPAARFLEDGWLILLFLGVLLATGWILWLQALGWGWIAGGSAAMAVAVTVAAWQLVRPIARRQVGAIVPALQAAFGDARGSLSAALQSARADAESAHRELVERRDRELAFAKADYKRRREEEKQRYEQRKRDSIAQFAARRQTIEDRFERELSAAEATYPDRIARLEEAFERAAIDMAERFSSSRVASEQQMNQERAALESQWRGRRDEVAAAAAAMNEYCDRHFPTWNEVQTDHQPAAARPAADLAALCIGHYEFAIPGGEPQALRLPAVLSYPERPSLLLEAGAEGRDAAMRAMQNVMLRLLSSFPPGKVRFTIIDPVGLGQNFSMFMHLADYDERLVNNRIWTETAHINQRLADLTEHMENVIQKYLRNEFASIQEYNRHAGEVAEPFQILVVANFPANSSEDAARRLVSIASSGARCGVYTLISTDDRLKLPRNFDLADLEAHAATLVWQSDQQRFAWKDQPLAQLPLTLEDPPADERFTDIIRAVGSLAKDAARVEVPFESVVPPREQWWSADSRSEIEVPLGRVGATKKQHLRLGKGTSQHVLIAGKTGSGKSTLLNALITNLAIHYSPRELEFYLIDFKKGVEFKAYAAQRLPHARVIAIESEREFGLSVLARLDDELKRRGDLFRKAGVQDVKGYRTVQPDAVMPRILLVIDEFQEFFTSDDKIAHDAALLLDRLVRQGRAFGIHVLLGSQTLAGAYSLARSTIGQMAVRIALQCSESDAHLILSEDNTAARLLSRPGEAIYNDANGLFEGNHPFQVVWLADHQREGFLQALAEMAADRRLAMPPPTIFEGNVAADPADNAALVELIEAGSPAASAPAPRAWLGAAVAIKEPTEVVFRRQGGANLLIVGQQEELALGILHSGLTSLSAQLRPANGGPPSFIILDGAREQSPEAGHWKRSCQRLAIEAQIASPREASAAVAQVAEEVDRRLASSEPSAEPLFVVIHNLARFRELKKSDDFSFDAEGSTAAARQLTTILREGPAVGIHTLLWCDSYSTLSRWLDRQTLRDLEMRVLLTMSAADSSNLMDSPAASRLSVHTALYYSDASGEAEKFRPYGLPSAAWQQWVGERLSRRPFSTPEGEAAEESAIAHP